MTGTQPGGRPALTDPPDPAVDVRALAEAARRSGTLAVLLSLATVVVYVVALGSAADDGNYELWSSLLIAPALLAASIPLIRRAAETERDRGFVRFLTLALVLKLAAALVRYKVETGVYGEIADAGGYARAGARLADGFRHANFDLGPEFFPLVGTRFMELVTGVVFTFTGPTAMGGFLVFSWLGFWGLYLFYRAFRIGLPEGDARRYRLLLFLVPSLLFWSSSIGKESWMLLTLGTAVYGGARLLESRRGGLILLVVGLLGAGLVRPHMSALVVAGLAAASLRRRSRRPTPTHPIFVTASMIVVVGLGIVAVSQTERFFGVEGGSGLESAEKVLDKTSTQTNIGGSQFEPVNARNPTQLPLAVATVLFRPLPTEADNPQMLAASLESTALFLLTLASFSRLRHLPRTAWRRPYVLFAVVYGLLFVVAFSTFGNFGILVRQRTQLLPLFLALLCIPAARPDHTGPAPS